MTASTAERFRSLAADFTRTAEQVPDWSAPVPSCPGWVARDVVGHLAGWMGELFLRTWGREAPVATGDPVTDWAALRDALQVALDDPALAATERDTRTGRITLDAMMAMAGLPDVLVHRWDLARAAGLDDRLDPAEIAGMAAELPPPDSDVDRAMRASGHFGPRIELPEGADDQARVLAFLGRDPR